MIIDDHSRLLVGGELFYNDNACNLNTRYLHKADDRNLSHNLDGLGYLLYRDWKKLPHICLLLY